jgi:hypothetical protein
MVVQHSHKQIAKTRRILFTTLLGVGLGMIVAGYIIEKSLGLIFGGMIFSGIALNGLYANKKWGGQHTSRHDKSTR